MARRLIHVLVAGCLFGCSFDYSVIDPLEADGGTKGDGTGVDGKDSAPVPCTPQTFKYADSPLSFRTPAGARFLHVKAWGAGGKPEGLCAAPDGGAGGFSEGIFAIGGDLPLVVVVGRKGPPTASPEDRMRFGFGGSGGGGLSGVFKGGELVADTDTSRAMILAGGGGAAGSPTCKPGATGNATGAGGMSSMQGGNGADPNNGGGGGYSGGKGGAKGEPGVGGTGFVSADALEQRTLSSDPLYNPPRTDDPDYDGIAGKSEAHGLVVLDFPCERPSFK